MAERTMPGQPGDYGDLSETLVHLVEVYTLPVVLDRLGYVVYAGSAVPWPRGAAYDDVGRALRALSVQAEEAGGGDAGRGKGEK